MVGNELAIRASILKNLGIDGVNSGASYGPFIDEPSGGQLVSFDPSEGTPIAKVQMAAEEDYDDVVYEAVKSFEKWRMFPAPRRGAIIREIGDELRKYKQDLGTLVSLEMGKSIQEGLGEVQEMIDVADFAVGLSRQLYGLTMPSERPPASHVRAVASARRNRRHHRLQLPGRSLVLERPHCGSLRRLCSLETIAGNAAHRHRRSKNLPPRPRTPRLDRRIQSPDRRRRRDR